MATYTSEEKQQDCTVVNETVGGAASTNDEGKSQTPIKEENDKQMVEMDINVDLTDKTVEILYKNKIFTCDLDTFIETYLLSNIFRTNDNIIKFISKNKPNLVNETKSVLSIIYTVESFDFNIIFEIPYNDFELNLSKCHEKDKIDQIYLKIQKLNNIISFNDLVLNRYEIKISKPFHNFTLNECIKHLDSLYVSYLRYGQSNQQSIYVTSYYQYKYIEAFANQFYTSSGSGSGIGDQTLADEAVSISKSQFDFKEAERCGLLFDMFGSHQYYLDEYNNRFQFSHNINQSIKNYRNIHPKLFLEPSIFEMHEKSPREVNSIFGKDIIIGTISVNNSQNIEIGQNYKELKCKRFYQIKLNSTHSANSANKYEYRNCNYVYVPTIEKNKIILKFIFAVVPQRNGSNGSTSMRIVKSNPADILDGSRDYSSSVQNVVNNPISANVAFNTYKSQPMDHYTTLNVTLPLDQIVFEKIFS